MSSLRMRKKQCALSEIIQQKRRSHDTKPIDLDRLFTEMSQISVESFSTGSHKKNGTEHKVSRGTIHHKKFESITRIDCSKNSGMLHDAHKSQKSNHCEPNENDWTKDCANP